MFNITTKLFFPFFKLEEILHRWTDRNVIMKLCCP